MTRARDLASTALNSTVNTTELGYLDGVTSSVQTQLDAKAPAAAPTFTGTVVLPSTTSIGNVSSTEIGYVDGVTSAIQTQIDSKLATATATSTYAPLASPTFTGTVTIPASASITAPVLISPEERMTVSATAAGSTVQFDADTQGVLYYTTTSTGNWVLNVRGTSGTTLASKLATGDSVTISFIATNVTAYYMTSLTIDGNAQTVKWSGGTAPSAGNASSTDVYQFTIIKTAATPTYTVLGAGPVKYS